MLEIIGLIIIAIVIFAGMAGSPEGVLPVFLIGSMMWGLTALIWKITGLDIITLFCFGFLGWIYLVYLMRKWNEKKALNGDDN